MLNSSHALSAWIFQRGISFVYVMAFFSLSQQILGLFGKKGILSIDNLLAIVEEQNGVERLWQMPTLFWLNSSDFVLYSSCVLGLLASTFAFLGMATGWMLLVCWLLYLSIVTAGQDFMGYQWDSLLLEVGFLTLFLVPWDIGISFWNLSEPDPVLKMMIFFVAFKLIFQSGVVKLSSEDTSWRELSALNFHYWTQPLPNPLSMILNWSPTWLKKIKTLLVLVLELALPMFLFGPEKIRVFVAMVFILFQLLLFLSGNFAFFNLLSIVLMMFFIPDWWWLQRFPSLHQDWNVVAAASEWKEALIYSLAFVLSAANIFWLIHSLNFPTKWTRFMLPLIRFLYPFKVSNSYGLFAVMTKSRFEVLLQGSEDGIHWTNYEFMFKPDAESKVTGLAAPYHPRLDWQLWFAALGDFEQSPWLNNLVARIFWNSEDVLGLFKNNPFPEAPPVYLRFRKIELVPLNPKETWQQKKWWRQIASKAFGPVYCSKDMPKAFLES